MSETGTRRVMKQSLPIFIFNDFAERITRRRGLPGQGVGGLRGLQ